MTVVNLLEHLLDVKNLFIQSVDGNKIRFEYINIGRGRGRGGEGEGEGVKL